MSILPAPTSAVLYEAAAQKEMIGMAAKLRQMRDLVDTAVDMLAVIARPMPPASQLRQALDAEITAIRSAANAISKAQP